MDLRNVRVVLSAKPFSILQLSHTDRDSVTEGSWSTAWQQLPKTPVNNPLFVGSKGTNAAHCAVWCKKIRMSTSFGKLFLQMEQHRQCGWWNLYLFLIASIHHVCRVNSSASVVELPCLWVTKQFKASVSAFAVCKRERTRGWSAFVQLQLCLNAAVWHQTWSRQALNTLLPENQQLFTLLQQTFLVKNRYLTPLRPTISSTFNNKKLNNY